MTALQTRPHAADAAPSTPPTRRGRGAWLAAPVAACAGVALLLALPPYGLWWLAPVGVALLALTTFGRTLHAAALLGLVCGLVLFVPLLAWTSLHLNAAPWLLLSGAEAVLAGLDDEQRAAAQAVTGPVCILAGAGTGKTRTITHRIAYGVHLGAFVPEQVLAVTFTARAAGELRGRLAGLGVGGVQARTFHAAAMRQLRYFAPRVLGGPMPSLVENKLHAVHRLRLKIAAEVREPIDLLHFEPPDWFLSVRREKRIEASHRHPYFAATAGLVLDLLSVLAGNPASVAINLGVTTTAVIKLLEKEPILWTAANRIRAARGMPALTHRR